MKSHTNLVKFSFILPHSHHHKRYYLLSDWGGNKNLVFITLLILTYIFLDYADSVPESMVIVMALLMFLLSFLLILIDFLVALYLGDSTSDTKCFAFLQLLCQYEPDSVLKFLETFDSYRVEHCLRLCQEYGIIDAAAFLLERVGDVGSALLLTLSGLDSKFVELDTALGGLVSNGASSSAAGSEDVCTVLYMKEVCRYDF